MIRISIIVPLYNEEESLNNFYNKLLLPELKKLSYHYELIFIDDGSKDKTVEIINNIAENNNITLISFSRNFGKEIALAAGLKEARGDAIIMLDGDGQHPPKYIHSFIKKWEDGNDAVIAVRSQYKKHAFLKRLGSKLFYKIINTLGKNNIIPNSMDFCLIDRCIVDEFNTLSEHNRITRGLISWLGFKQTYISVDCDERIAGKAGYDLRKLTTLALDSFASMSITPLIIFGYIGVGITLLSGLLGLFVIVEQFIFHDPMNINFTGTACLSIFVTFLVGLVLVSQSVTALYIAQIHHETQNRPLYVINRKKSKNLK